MKPSLVWRPVLLAAQAAAIIGLSVGGRALAADPKVNGKTAQEWEAEADRLLAQARAATPGARAAAPAPKAATAPQTRTQGATPAPAAAKGAAGAIQPGRYNCIAGFRVMLTLGEMTIDGNRYTFRPPTGPATSGTYVSTGPRSFHWSGDIGAIKNSQLVDSQFDGATQTVDFWFTYHVTPGDIPSNLACQKLQGR